MLSLRPIALADLLLSRLLFAMEEGLTVSELKQATRAVAGTELSGAAFAEQVEAALMALQARGHVQCVRRARYQITAAGQPAILALLGLAAQPSSLRWDTFKSTDWIAYALKLPSLSPDTRKQLAAADGLRAAILKQVFALPVAHFASLTATRNALLWQHLCHPQTAATLQERLPALQQQAFNQGAVMSALLNDLLQASKALPWEKALPQLVAKIANAKRTAPDELRLAILRQALVQVPPAALRLPDAKRTLQDFAQATLEAARATQAGRVGDNKVFISAVWETLQQSAGSQISLSAFKQQLLTANQQRLLTLSRADMSYALDQNAVSASELKDMNSIFHFIRLD
ncbi:MAG: hypothetical protein KF832_01945 [Caldilineaceae bacterium]|nr:hypothetical protein [Caldilineaceae bacterium]